MQIPAVKQQPYSKNKCSLGLTVSNCKTKANNKPSFKEGEELLIPVMFWAVMAWGGSLVFRRVMRIFNKTGSNDNIPQ